MVVENVNETVSLPEGITASINNGDLSIVGSKGTVTRNFIHPKVAVSVNNTDVVFSTKKFTKNEKKIMKTFIAHTKNMIKGSTEGHEYKLKICSGHFPMNVSIKGSSLEVKNFIGEVVPRVLKFSENVSAKVEGEIITVSGIDKEIVAQLAASIEQLTRRSGFDRRIFQDGIYIIEKDGKKVE